MALVDHIVREIMTRVPAHVRRDELTSAGLLALTQAAQGFEESRGIPFARYAAYRIRGGVLDELRSADWASRRVRRRAREIEETRTRLAVRLERTATAEEVARELGIGIDEVLANDEDVDRAHVVSLDGFTTGTLEELVPDRQPGPESAAEHEEALTYLMEAISELPERLRLVVRGYFLDERPMADLAAELGVTDSRISQMRAEALVMLRDALHSAFDPALLAPVQGMPGGVKERRRQEYLKSVAARHDRERRRGRPL
jgi:RNA polymerase sigma factor for flagellar operon FliA